VVRVEVRVGLGLVDPLGPDVHLHTYPTSLPVFLWSTPPARGTPVAGAAGCGRAARNNSGGSARPGAGALTRVGGPRCGWPSWEREARGDSTAAFWRGRAKMSPSSPGGRTSTRSAPED